MPYFFSSCFLLSTFLLLSERGGVRTTYLIADVFQLVKDGRLKSVYSRLNSIWMSYCMGSLVARVHKVTSTLLCEESRLISVWKLSSDTTCSLKNFART